MSETTSEKRSTALRILIVVAGVLLVAVVVLLLALLLIPPTGSNAAATASPTPPVSSASMTPTGAVSPTPIATANSTDDSASGANSESDGSSQSAPTPTPTTTAKKPLMQVFNTGRAAPACVTGTPEFPAQLNFDLTFSYSARDTVAVYIGIDTFDPVANPFEGPLPATGSIVVPFSCYGPQLYSWAAIGADGSRDVGSITIRNYGDPGPYAN